MKQYLVDLSSFVCYNNHMVNVDNFFGYLWEKEKITIESPLITVS